MPAKYAPTITERPMTSASMASAKHAPMPMNSMFQFGLSLLRLWFMKSWTFGITYRVMSSAAATKPNAFTMVKAIPAGEVSPTANPEITDRMVSANISEITAAFMIILPSLVFETFRCFITWAATPALVVIIMVAMKRADIRLPPMKYIRRSPRMNGVMMPSSAANVAVFPTLIRSDIFVSRPTVNRRKIIPSSENSIRTLYPSLPSEMGVWTTMPICARRFQSPRLTITRFAATIPNTISPIIPGRCIFLKMKDPRLDRKNSTNSITTSDITSTKGCQVIHLIKRQGQSS